MLAKVRSGVSVPFSTLTIYGKELLLFGLLCEPSPIFTDKRKENRI